MASFFRTVCRAASTILISGLLCASGLPETQPDRPSEIKHRPAKKLHLTGVSNFGEVTPFLYRGAQPSREGYQGLAKMGIDIVVDARLSGKAEEKKAVNRAGMQYISIPWHCMF
ncbi:MAG TPA: hypothetical protein VJS37_00935, partial [Terriglobales bacterium]|nr:hypothetical protein [Terriglobales bacterium]